MLKKLTSPIGSVLIFCLVAGFVFFFSSQEPSNETTASPTAALFDLTLPDENGAQQALNQWQGKTIVLNFWATWCAPCREEMPELSELHTEHQDKNVVVLGIALDEAGAIKTFTNETPVSYPLLVAEDIGSPLAAQLGNDKSALPYTVIIKPNGDIKKTFFGRISKALLEEHLPK